MKKVFFSYFSIFLFLFLCFYGCSPIKSSSESEKVQMELSLHEAKTNLDDVKHDLKCLKVDLQILDKKIQNNENLSEVVDLKIKEIEVYLEKRYDKILTDIKKLYSNQKNVKSFLGQYEEKITELEKIIASQNKQFDKINDLKKTLNQIASSLKEGYLIYKVKPGDSLKAIAKTYDITVSSIRKINGIKGDLIVVGQELKIPR